MAKAWVIKCALCNWWSVPDYRPLIADNHTHTDANGKDIAVLYGMPQYMEVNGAQHS